MTCSLLCTTWKNRPPVGTRHQRSLRDEAGRANIDSKSSPIRTIPEKPARSRWPPASALSAGTDSTLVIPADIPLMEAWELEEILKHAPTEGSVLVPAGDGRGTNAAFRRPANLFPLRFGNDSFKPHHAAAQATGKPCVVLNFAGNRGRRRQSRRPRTIVVASR